MNLRQLVKESPCLLPISRTPNRSQFVKGKGGSFFGRTRRRTRIYLLQMTKEAIVLSIIDLHSSHIWFANISDILKTV